MRRCFILIYTIIQIAKELCRVVLLNLEKNRKKVKCCFHRPRKGPFIKEWRIPGRQDRHTSVAVFHAEKYAK